MSKFDANKYLLFQKKLSEFYSKRQHRVIENTDITKAQADVLVFLANHKNLNTAADIVKYRGFSKAYVSKAIEMLLSKNYIISETDRSDRRYNRLFLDKKSSSIVKKLIAVQDEFGDVLFESIDSENRKLFFEIFNQMMDNLIANEEGDMYENN